MALLVFYLQIISCKTLERQEIRIIIWSLLTWQYKKTAWNKLSNYFQNTISFDINKNNSLKYNCLQNNKEYNGKYNCNNLCASNPRIHMCHYVSKY